jgi:hypothetical protein
LVATKAAFLEARRVHDDQAVRAGASDFSPALEEVMRQEGCATGEAVECMVLLPDRQRALAHVQIHHLPGAGLQRHHREGAGVRKQVQHLQSGVGGAMGAHPASAFGHVQEQAVVLPFQQVHPKK